MMQSTRGGKTVLFILGLGLIVYALFAVLNGFYVREFPTRVPSGVPHGQKTPMARAVSTMMTKASFRWVACPPPGVLSGHVPRFAFRIQPAAQISLLRCGFAVAGLLACNLAGCMRPAVSRTCTLTAFSPSPPTPPQGCFRCMTVHLHAFLQKELDAMQAAAWRCAVGEGEWGCWACAIEWRPSAPS